MGTSRFWSIHGGSKDSIWGLNHIESINGNCAIKNWDLGIFPVLLPEAGDHCFYPYIYDGCVIVNTFKQMVSSHGWN